MIHDAGVLGALRAVLQDTNYASGGQRVRATAWRVFRRLQVPIMACWTLLGAQPSAASVEVLKTMFHVLRVAADAASNSEHAVADLYRPWSNNQRQGAGSGVKPGAGEVPPDPARMRESPPSSSTSAAQSPHQRVQQVVRPEELRHIFVFLLRWKHLPSVTAALGEPENVAAIIRLVWCAHTLQLPLATRRLAHRCMFAALPHVSPDRLVPVLPRYISPKGSATQPGERFVLALLELAGKAVTRNALPVPPAFPVQPDASRAQALSALRQSAVAMCTPEASDDDNPQLPYCVVLFTMCDRPASALLTCDGAGLHDVLLNSGRRPESWPSKGWRSKAAFKKALCASLDHGSCAMVVKWNSRRSCEAIADRLARNKFCACVVPQAKYPAVAALCAKPVGKDPRRAVVNAQRRNIAAAAHPASHLPHRASSRLSEVLQWDVVYGLQQLAAGGALCMPGNPWEPRVRSALRSQLLQLPSLIPPNEGEATSSEARKGPPPLVRVERAIGAVLVIGGATPRLLCTGSRVLVSQACSSVSRPATVVTYHADSAVCSVLMDDATAVQEVPVACVQAVHEHETPSLAVLLPGEYTALGSVLDSVASALASLCHADVLEQPHEGVVSWGLCSALLRTALCNFLLRLVRGSHDQIVWKHLLRYTNLHSTLRELTCCALRTPHASVAAAQEAAATQHVARLEVLARAQHGFARITGGGLPPFAERPPTTLALQHAAGFVFHGTSLLRGTTVLRGHHTGRAFLASQQKFTHGLPTWYFEATLPASVAANVDIGFWDGTGEAGAASSQVWSHQTAGGFHGVFIRRSVLNGLCVDHTGTVDEHSQSEYPQPSFQAALAAATASGGRVTLGCGWDLDTGEVYFTQNGTYLGAAARIW